MIDFINSGLLLDIIVIAIILINVISGAKKGFIKTVYSFFKLILAACAGFIFCAPLAEILKATDFYKKLMSDLATSIGGYISGLSEESFEAITQQTQQLGEILEKLRIPTAELEAEYARLAAENSENITESITTYIITPASNAIVTAIAFVAIFFAALLVLFVLMKLLDLVTKAPVINGANKLLGFAAGFVVALIVIFILSMIIDTAMPYIEGLDIGITSGIVENSKLYKWFSAVNPIGLIIAFFPV